MFDSCMCAWEREVLGDVGSGEGVNFGLNDHAVRVEASEDVVCEFGDQLGYVHDIYLLLTYAARRAQL